MFTSRDEGSTEMEDVLRTDKGVTAGVVRLSATREAWDAQTVESAEDSGIGGVEKKPQLAFHPSILYHGVKKL